MPDVTADLPPSLNAVLMLADGSLFFGQGIGKPGTKMGEICFNTAMTGYQEVLTDPSYAGQIITFTSPHIGNVGANPEDYESTGPYVRGLVVREMPSPPSNWRSRQSFGEWLAAHDVTGIAGVDTRALTRHIRLKGAQNAAIHFRQEGEAFDLDTLKKGLLAVPSLEGLDLARDVTCDKPHEWTQTGWQAEGGYGSLDVEPDYHVVAIDFGAKYNILRNLATRGCKVTVVPATTSADDILAMGPDGIFLSNGPGDPAATGAYAVMEIKQLLGAGIPIFGICLGHQLLALALGGKTEKMHQGHRGANQPVRREEDRAVEITSQNHGFMTTHSSLPTEAEVTHLSLFDGVVEGLKVKGKPIFSVQYHPEASPGPHDSFYLFDQFIEMIRVTRAKKYGAGK